MFPPHVATLYYLKAFLDSLPGAAPAYVTVFTIHIHTHITPNRTSILVTIQNQQESYNGSARFNELTILKSY